MTSFSAPPRTGTAAVLVSGGLDSALLLAEMARGMSEVTPLYIQAGLAWEEIELHWLSQFLKALPLENVRPLVILSLPIEDIYGSHWSLAGENVPTATSEDRAVYLPGRNILLLCKAAVYCSLQGIPTLALALLKGNPFPDATGDFFAALETALSTGLAFPLRLLTPFAALTKAEVIPRGRSLPLHLTFSCINPTGLTHCGACNKCAERRAAFRAAGIPDRTGYDTA